ncbi:Sugar phosphate isomerase/epimerase [Flavobacteriaceae bacterium MAR_2010_188]|nr:Sugar phosphate isomerase/epimerase [Flavobacteriaceae bacterium MAR_2010_188]
MKVQFKRRIFANLFILFLTISITSCKENSEKEEVTEVAVEEVAQVDPFFKLSLAEWSLHKAIMDKSMSPFAFAEKAKEYGFSGLEYVSQLYTPQIEKMGMQAVMDTLLAKSKEHGMTNVLIMVDGEGDLADPSVKVRDEAVEKHKKWVDAAQFLGCHAIRVNTFGSNEPKEWNKGVVDGLTKLSKYAATKNINVLVENHGWLSSDIPKLMAAINEVNMPNCGTLPDFGNFCIKRKEGERWGECEEEYADIYDGVKQMMTKAKAVSAKSYDFDDDGYETKLDYPRLMGIVKDAGYTGFVGVEYEGDRLSEEEGIMATKELLLKSVQDIEKN